MLKKIVICIALISCFLCFADDFNYELLKNPSKASDSKVCDDRGHIKVMTFSGIVDTANRRLFRLRTTLSDRYEKISGIDLQAQAEQLNLL